MAAEQTHPMSLGRQMASQGTPKLTCRRIREASDQVERFERTTGCHDAAHWYGLSNLQALVSPRCWNGTPNKEDGRLPFSGRRPKPQHRDPPRVGRYFFAASEEEFWSFSLTAMAPLPMRARR